MRKLKLIFACLLMAVLSIGQVWADEVVYKQTIFNSTNNSQGVQNYTSSWSNTTDYFTVNITNANNNNNGWSYIKIGQKNSASTGTIVTNSTIDKAVTKVDLTIDAITAANVTSITLYTSSNKSTWSSVGTFAKSTGTQSVSLTTPTADLYYKIEIVCTAKSNGLISISKVEFYAEEGGGDAPTYTITAQSNNNSYGTVSLEGSVITGDPANGYRYASTAYEVTSGTATVVQNGNEFTVTPESDCTVRINFEAIPTRAITWMVNGVALSGADLGGASTSVSDGSLITTLPSVADDVLGCTDKFMGWSRKNYNTIPKGTDAEGYNDLFTTGAGAGAINQAETFYAVFAKQTTSDPEEHNNVISWSRSETTNNYTTGYTFSATASDKSGYYQDASSGTGALKLYHTSTALFTSTPSSVTLTANIGAGQAASFSNYVYAQLLDKNGNGIGTPIQVTNNVATASGDTYTPSFDLTGITSAYGVQLYHVKENSKNIRYFSFSLSYVSGGTTYSNYVTKCATVAVPTFSVKPADGPFNTVQSVELNCETANAEIRYTTNGDAPTSASTLYESAIAVNQSMTIKAIAIKDGVESEAVSAAYVLKVKTPTISTDKTSFFDKATVTLACEDGGATIYYTIGEAEPVAYTEPFEVNATATVTAVAKRTGWTDSENASQNFTKIEILDVAGAIQAINAANGQNTEAKYVRGIISSNPTFDSKYNSLTYNLSADGEATSDQLKVYSGKSYDGANFSSASDLLIGDEVVVYGTMKLYQSTTYQFNYDNQLFERKQRVMSIALSGEYPIVFNENDEFVHTNMVVTATYNYGEDADVTANATWSTPEMSIAGTPTVTVSYTFDGKTVTKDYTITVNHVCASEITITKGEEVNGTFALSATGAVCGDGDGAEVEVTDIAPADGYRFKTITATAGDVGNDLKKVTGIKANATIGVEFEQIPTYQVTWNVNGDETTKTTVQEGSKPVFPATPVSCDDAADGSKTFIGWATAAWKGKKPLSEVSATIYTNASDMPEVNAAVTYYAVFAKGNPVHTITLDYEVFGLTGSYAQQTATVSGFGFTVNQGFKGSGNVIQMNSNKGNGTLYNTTAIAGLKSVTVNVSSGDKTYTITTGTSQNPTDNSQQSAATGTFNALSGDTYFQLRVSGASYFSSIEVTYEEPGFEYEDYMTSCCTKLGALNLTKAMSQHTDTLTWDAIDGVTAWSVSGNVKGGADIAADNIGEVTTINEGAQKQCIISNLTTNTLYEFQVSATTIADDYCTDVAVWSIEGTTDAAFVITAVASNDGAYGTVDLAGDVITATVKEYCRYASTVYEVTSGTATVVQNGNEFTVTPTSDCTVRINFEPIPITGVTMDAELALEIGDVTTPVATVTGETGANPNVQWSVEQEDNVISLDNGEITALAAGTATITATAVGNNTKSASCVVTVTEHVITPGEYAIIFGNAFFGTTGLDGSLTGANLKDYSGSKKDINVAYQKGTGSNMYLKDSEIRLYNGNALVVSVPEGYNITAITGLKASMTADEGTISGTSWSGKANTVTLSHANSSGNSALTTINVTFEAVAKYAVTFAAPTGGILTIKDGDDAIASGDEIAEDKVLDVTLTPADAYHGGTVKVVKTGVEPEVDVTATDYSEGHITIKDYAITVSASFAPDAAISVAVADDQSEWGSVKLYDGELNKVESGSTFKPDADFVIEATPSDPEVYEFVGWTISAGSDIVFTEENAADNDPALKAGEVNTTFTATFREKAQPYLQATKSALNFTTTAVGNNSQLTFDLSGENLAADATYEIKGDAKAMFSVVSPAFPIAQEEGVIAETVTVQYAPTAVSENHSATLTITSGAASVEITLSGSAETAYTAKWYVNGSEVTESTVTEVAGTALTFPANPASEGDCKNLTFVGWLTSELDEASENAPQGLITDATGLTMPENGITYYAVFAESEDVDNRAEYSYTITTEDFPGNGYAANNNEKTKMAACTSDPSKKVEVKWTSNQVDDQSSKIQGQKNTAYIYNAASWGKIKSITLNGNDGFSYVIGAEAEPTTTAEGGFFKISAGSSTSTATSMTIVFVQGDITTAYSNYVTSCVLCNKVTLAKVGEDANNTFALQVNDVDVTSVKTCSGDVAVNIVANPAIGNSASFAISGVEDASISGNVITIKEGAAGALTVTATFSQINYNVTMAQEGGAGATISGNQENKHYGEEITVTAEAVEGYGFTGWTIAPEVTFVENYDASMTTTKFIMPNANVTATANYALIANCRISFQVNGAEVAFAEQTQAQEYTITEVGANVPSFTWVGWSETEYADEVEVLPATISTYTPEAGEATKVLYGIYKRVDSSDPNAGNYEKVTSALEDYSGDYLIVYETGSKVWKGSATSDGNAIEVTIANNAIQANATTNAEKFVIASMTGGYSIQGTSGKYIAHKTKNNDVDNGTTYNDDPKENTISIDGDGNAVISSSTAILRHNNSNDNLFRYYKSSSAGQQHAIQLYKLNNTVTKYTSSPVEKVTITFNANGGQGGCNTAIINKGTQLMICETAPTKAQYDFNGWNSDADGNGTAYAAGTAYTFNADITLYAQWTEAATYTVTFDKNGGTGTAEAIEDRYAGDVITLPAALTKEDFDFKGWRFNGKNYKAGASFTMPANAVQFVAQWKKSNLEKVMLISSLDQLISGMEVVFAYQDANDASKSALNGDISEKYLASITDNVTFDNEKKTVSYGEGVVTLIVEQEANGWTFRKNATQYLKENTAKSLAWANKANATVWTIGFDEGNVVIANAATQENKMYYNASSPRFLTYASSGQKAIQLYGKANAITSGTTNVSDLGNMDDEIIVASGEGVILNVDVASDSVSYVAKNGATIVISATNDATKTTKSVIADSTSTIKVTKPTTVNQIFSVAATMGGGVSGQIAGSNLVTIAQSTDAYFDITLGDNANPEHWHAIAVPFPVDVINGIYDAVTGNKLENEKNYAIMEYHGNLRAQGLYGWKKIRTTLKPGVFYLMTVDGNTKTFRFKMAGTTLPTGDDLMLSLYKYAASGAGDEGIDAGWNGVANPTLEHGSINKVVYVLNPNSYTYEDYDPSMHNFVVGTPFFIQSASDESNVAMADTVPGKPYYAPKRVSEKSIENIKVFFGNEAYKDKLTISANEEALNEYQIGKDLVKMTMTSTPKVAQIFGNAYNAQMCRIYAPMSNDKAEYSLTLYAPNAGEYTISAPAMENADLYLTYNGSIIWNLSTSEYTNDFEKGNNEGYGLLLVKKIAGMATGVETVTGDGLQVTGVQKIVIDDKVFILRAGQMYDVTGKMVK